MRMRGAGSVPSPTAAMTLAAPASPMRMRRIGIGLVLASLVVFAAAVRIGAAELDAGMIVALRLPRVLGAAGVGALLALSGLAMQVLLRNPLADPFVLGTSGGAAVGALLALMAGASLWPGAALGAGAAAALLVALSRSSFAAADDASPRLILIGAMLSALFGAVSTLLLTITPDPRLRGALFWLAGDFSGVERPAPALLAAALLAAGFIAGGRRVDRLLLGSEAAALLGEPVRGLRLALFAGASAGAGIAVATAGAIGFVGLVVPQALRLAGVPTIRHLAWTSALGGAALLVMADLLARTVAAPVELPVGAVMALVGAPFFIRSLARAEA